MLSELRVWWGMEACGSAHAWARRLIKLGYTVKLMAPQFVKAYVKTNQNDAADAEAIWEAVQRPNMRFVPVKTEEQPAVPSLHRAPLGAGRVAGRLLERIAKARQVKPIQIALAWLLKRSPVILPIPGTSSIAHLEENMQAASLQWSEREYLELTGISELAS